MKRKSMRMGQSGPPPRAVCALVPVGKSDAAPSRAHRCCVDSMNWNSSLKAPAAQCVWALGNLVPMKAVYFRMGKTGL